MLHFKVDPFTNNDALIISVIHAYRILFSPLLWPLSENFVLTQMNTDSDAAIFNYILPEL